MCKIGLKLRNKSLLIKLTKNKQAPDIQYGLFEQDSRIISIQDTTIWFSLSLLVADGRLGREMLGPGRLDSGLIYRHDGTVGMANQAAVVAASIRGGMSIAGGGVRGVGRSMGRQMIGASRYDGRLVSGHDGAVGMGHKGGGCVGSNAVGGISNAVAGQVVGASGGHRRFVSGHDRTVGVSHQSGVVQRPVVDCRVSDDGGGYGGVGGGGMAGISDPVAGQVVGSSGGHCRLVDGDDGAVRVRHQAVESAGGRSSQAHGRQENLHIKYFLYIIFFGKVYLFTYSRKVRPNTELKLFL
jgi:hypothetical protein